MDARSKLVLSFYFVAIIFLCNNWQTYLLLAAFVLMCVKFSDLGIGFFIKGVKPLLGLIRFYRAFAGVFHQGRPRLLGFRSAVLDAFWDRQRLLRLLSLRFDRFHVDAFDADDCAA